MRSAADWLGAFLGAAAAFVVWRKGLWMVRRLFPDDVFALGALIGGVCGLFRGGQFLEWLRADCFW